MPAAHAEPPRNALLDVVLDSLGATTEPMISLNPVTRFLGNLSGTPTRREKKSGWEFTAIHKGFCLWLRGEGTELG
jgi:hypothetical protein